MPVAAGTVVSGQIVVVVDDGISTETVALLLADTCPAASFTHAYNVFVPVDVQV